MKKLTASLAWPRAKRNAKLRKGGSIEASSYGFSSLGVTSPFFPGILLSRKPPTTLGKWLVFEKNDG